jgi:acetolactate synthase-1/3 small subunit
MTSDATALFTLSIVTENESGSLIRLAMTLARHRMQIQSLTSTSDEIGGTSRHIVLARARPDRVRRAMKQISACVGVLVADYYAEGDTVDREIALFKLEIGGGAEASLRDLARTRRARVVVQGGDYVIIEKTGCGREIQELYETLQPFGVMEFVRSGRVMVTKAGQTALTEVPTATGVSPERHL